MRSITFKITEKLTAGIELEAGFFFSLDNWTRSIWCASPPSFPPLFFKPGFDIIAGIAGITRIAEKLVQRSLAIPTINRLPYDRCDRREKKGECP